MEDAMDTLPNPNQLDPHLLIYMNNIGYDKDTEGALSLVDSLVTNNDTRALIEMSSAIEFAAADQIVDAWMEGIELCGEALDKDASSNPSSTEMFEVSVESFLNRVSDDHHDVNEKEATKDALHEQAIQGLTSPFADEILAFMARLSGDGPENMHITQSLLKQNAAMLTDALWGLVKDGQDYERLSLEISPEHGSQNMKLWRVVAKQEVAKAIDELQKMQGWIAKNR